MKANLFIILLVIFVSQLSVFSKENVGREIEKNSCSCESKQAVREYFEQLETQQKFIAQCETDNEERRKLFNLPKPVKISGFGPNPVSLVKPYYPKIARQLKISGVVIVEVLTDEKGLVIYSKVLKCNSFLREGVRKAACLSKFTPIQYCGKPVKTRWLIRYNFTAN